VSEEAFSAVNPNGKCPVSPRQKGPVSGIVSTVEIDMKCGGTVTMSAKELNPLEVLGRVAERRLTQRRAAEHFGLREPAG
jgi:hypothetical protein